MKLNNNSTHFLKCTILLLSIVLLSSCGIGKNFYADQELNNYPGTIYLSNGESKTGQVGMPSSNSKTVLLKAKGKADESIEAEKVDRIEFTANLTTDKVHIVRYLPVKGMFNKKSNRWVVCFSEGPYTSAYVGAANYKINADGTMSFVGTRQVVNHGNGTMIVNPSYPVYMMKKGDDALTQVALTKGISFEDSAFRSGVSNFLHDDPQLTEYIQDEKWGFDNMNSIVQNYNPNRGNSALVIDGVTIAPRKRSLLTNDFNKEMIWYVESALPSDDKYSAQFGIGIRSTIHKFFTYGVDIGYASAKYIDQTKRLENHSINDIDKVPVEARDLSKQGLFRVNASLGGQLPFRFNKIYLIPGAHLGLGAMLGSEYSTFYYGPMATLDLGFKLKRGNIFLIGGGYRHNIPLKGDEAKAEASGPGFEAYEPYGNILIRAAYKF